MPPTRYAKTSDGVHIAYQVYGDGPVDVLLSGSLWWHLEFQWTDPSVVRVKERLARLGRVIEFDKRGTDCQIGSRLIGSPRSNNESTT